MANDNGDQSPPPVRRPELLPVILAIALAVVAQLALQDGLTLLAVAGYIVAAWLFVASLRDFFDGAPERLPAAEPVAPEPETAGFPAAQPGTAFNRLAYLRRHWRLVTLAEIFQGDIPPARLRDLAPSPPAQAKPDEEPQATGGQEAPADAAHLESWAASDSPASSPRAVKVTPQGDVLVLDTGLEQVQRFDAGGNLLATYSLTGLAGLEILDLAVSADGRTIYVVDAASNRLQVINLAVDEDGEDG